MTTKECKECGVQPVTQFNTNTKGKTKGALCKVCNNKLRAERSAAARGPIKKDEEREAILNKYKDDPIERKKNLDNLKAKRFRKRLQEKNKNKIPNVNLLEKSCIGDICKGKSAISGIPLLCKSKSNELSMDRINSQEDYTKDNIHLTSNTINIIKSDTNINDFTSWITKIKPNICLL